MTIPDVRDAGALRGAPMRDVPGAEVPTLREEAATLGLISSSSAKSLLAKSVPTGLAPPLLPLIACFADFVALSSPFAPPPDDVLAVFDAPFSIGRLRVP